MKVLKKEKILFKNLGIQIFRMILCFWVVLDHCLIKENRSAFYILLKNRLHVPSFILISFYFSYNIITKRNVNKIKKRFERLLIPYFIFPIIILFINNFSFSYFKFNILGGVITFRDLILQYIIGRKFIAVFWYQFYLIWTTLLFIIISFLMKDNYLFVLELIYMLSYILRYSDLNYIFFENFGGNIKLSIGIFVEIMPMSISGSLLASLNIFELLNKHYKKTIFFAFGWLIIIYKYNIFTNIKGFVYGGIILDICSILSFIIFYLSPINYFQSHIFYKTIYQITNYTQGIYSLHLIMQKSLNSKFITVKNGNFIGCIIIYIFSYFISFIGEKITKKTKLKYLFI
jgi:fucose 4-O-acetylase-like acetyltransferase